MKINQEKLPVILIMTILNMVLLFNFYQKEQLLHGIGYVLFFYMAILLIHFFTEKFKSNKIIEVKNPEKEVKIVLIFAALGILFISIDFYLKYKFSGMGFLIRMPVLIGVLFFTIPTGILIYFLKNKYKLLDLGIKTLPIHIILGIIVWGLTGIFAYFFYPEGMLWTKGLKEFGGVSGIILEGIIGAALVEEFSRYAIQTRLEKILKIKGLQILIATLLWALMHFPVNFFRSHDVYGALLGCVKIMPLGFVWGYLMHRTRSILPSIFAHGLNLWGFQNW
jgi:membrane protease YdiL (CAAX protease family)